MSKEREERKIKITGIGPEDAYYNDRERYIGLVGMFKPNVAQVTPGYWSGYFSLEGRPTMCFFAIRYKRVKEDE